jgi:hypothetical protein
MRRSHELLNLAKGKGDRNGLALELEKRSGGGRMFMAQWKEIPFEGLQLKEAQADCLLNHLAAAGKALGSSENRSMSVSLAYRLEQFRPGLEAIVNEVPEQLSKFLDKQMERSRQDESNGKVSLLAQQVAALIARKRQKEAKLGLNTESLIIAKFIGGRMSRLTSGEGGQQ